MGPVHPSLAKYIRDQVLSCRMISVRSLLTSVSVITILCLTFSKITRNEEGTEKAEKLNLRRKVIKEKCLGVEQEVYLSQWRIKMVVEEMNLHCSSSYLLVKEDSEKPRRVKYCNEEQTGSQVFFSHEHVISILFKNKAQCKEAGGCDGTQYQIRLSAEYVCGGKYDKDNGVITSPFFPNNYINYEACIYDIVAPKKKRIALTCEYFTLSPKCLGKCGDHNGDKTYFQ